MNLEDIVLSEIIQSQKDKYCMVLLLGDIQSSQTHRSSSYVETLTPMCPFVGGREGLSEAIKVK